MSDTLDRILAARRVEEINAAFRAQREQIAAEPCEECDEEPETAASDADIIIHGLGVVYDEPTGDGRRIRGGALRWNTEEHSIPIIWDRQDGDHTGMVLGKVDVARNEAGGWFVEQGRLFATDDPEAKAAVARVVELIAENAIGWSVMLNDEDVEIRHREPSITESSDGTIVARFKPDDDEMEVISAEVRHLALVDTPAFAAARPVLGPEPALTASMATAAMTFPADHFQRWESREPVPLQVTPGGRVWGHAAGDGCFRNGGPMCKKYTPDPDRSMRNFHTHTTTLDTGAVIRTGVLTCSSLHADVTMSLEQQRRHHEDTSTVWARVVAWDDSRGRLCISGSVLPGLDERTLAQVSGTALSVERWPVPGTSGLTLVGAHAVNSPAWPVAASLGS